QRPSRAQAGQPEWGDAKPRAVVERIDLESCGHVLAHVGSRNLPVREEQVLPRLPQRPAAPRQRPGAMLDVLERARLSCRRVERTEHLYDLEIAAQGLLTLDRLEQRLEVAVAEAACAVPLDQLEDAGRPVR